MKSAKELERELESLRARLSKLAEAGLRINESLEFETVLQEVLDSACALTEARYGVLAPFDETGDIQAEAAFHFGFTSTEWEHMWQGLTGSEFCQFFEGLPGPTRLRDLEGHLASLGLPGFRPPVQVNTPYPFLGVVLRHGSQSIGAIYLADKTSGPEFTDEDEETLVMFAAQAALVMANSRQYRDEQRARADLETLINTSPVGVVVFDAATGAPLSINREARRMVEGLVDPGEPAESLMETITARWIDGREVSLAEQSISDLLINADTLLALELVLSVPDGRSITVLVNVTPMRSEDGETESVVVTLQDLTALGELEKLRAEFLAMVSHELRTPLAAIKGSAVTLTETVADLGPAEMLQFFRIISDQSDHMRDLISDLLDVARIETGTLPVDPEPSDVRTLVDEARSRFQSAGGRSSLQMEIPQHLPEVMADRRRIVQVLVNLLSNAARSSHQSSPIKIAAEPEGVHVAISVSDDGVGIPSDRLPYLIRKFSRFEGEGLREDTGLGLAICKGIVEAHGGRIWAESDGAGLGSRFTFTIPAVEPAHTGSARLSGRSHRPERRRPRILCVDDDPQTLRYVRDALSAAGYAPIVTGDPDDALRLMEEEPHLVLLDLVLPGADGIDLMRKIREIADVPVIFLSAYGQDDVVAKAFDMGAVDYVVKPFSATELTARIRAALRRRAVPQMVEPSEPYNLGELTIDYAESRVTLAGHPVNLTSIEYRMLVELSVSAGRVLTNLQLLQRVWGLDNAGGSGSIRNIIKRLRRKLGDDARNPIYIFNEPRVGYLMPLGEA